VTALKEKEHVIKPYEVVHEVGDVRDHTKKTEQLPESEKTGRGLLRKTH